MIGMIMIALGVYVIGLLAAIFFAMEIYNDWGDSEVTAAVVLWPISLVFICAHGITKLYNRYYG